MFTESSDKFQAWYMLNFFHRSNLRHNLLFLFLLEKIEKMLQRKERNRMHVINPMKKYVNKIQPKKY